MSVINYCILVLLEEQVDFPFSAVVAETGGTLGLVLGLSILEIITFFATAWTYVTTRAKGWCQNIPTIINKSREQFYTKYILVKNIPGPSPQVSHDFNI